MSAALSGGLVGGFSGAGLVGVSAVSKATGIGIGVGTWLGGGVVVQGVGSGLGGAGVMSGSIIFEYGVSVGLVSGALKSAGVVGVMAESLAVGVVAGIMGVPHAVVGSSAGVGSGIFTGGVLGDAVSLEGALRLGLSSQGIAGLYPLEVSGLAAGINLMYGASVVTGSIVGAGSGAVSGVPVLGKILV